MNWIDYALIGLMILSCVAGVMRGFLREAISLVTWVLATWGAWAYADTLEPHLGGALAEAAVRPWAARTILFLLILLVGNVIGALVAQFVRLSLFSAVDRLWGFVFGALRGFVVVGLLAILAHALHLQGEDWYRQSVFVPYAEHLGNAVRVVAGESRIPGS